MDFAFSPEQEELRRTVRQFLDKTSPETDVRQLMASERGYDADAWHRMAEELGLLGLAIPEGYGGAGAGFTELGIVAQEMGRALFCGPFLGTAVLATAALLESADDAAQRRWLPGIAAGELIATLALPGSLPGADGDPAWEVAALGPDAAGGWVLDGTAGFVLDGHLADLVLVPAATREGTSLFAVRGSAPGLARTVFRPSTRPASTPGCSSPRPRRP